LTVLTLLLLLAPAGRGQAGSFAELEVRAVYLYNFAAFVDWPDTAFASPSSPLRYCVLGTPALRAKVRQVLEGESAAGRPLELADVEGATGWRSCHLIYFDHSALPRASHILSEVARNPTLTVGESEAFARQGGMIGLVRKGERLRSYINRDVIAETGIRISSKLLRISTLVDAEGSSPAP
jgi:hypothetical protein